MNIPRFWHMGMAAAVALGIGAAPAMAQTLYVTPPNAGAAQQTETTSHVLHREAQQEDAVARRDHAIANYDAATGNYRGAAAADQQANAARRDALATQHQAVRDNNIARRQDSWQLQTP